MKNRRLTDVYTPVMNFYKTRKKKETFIAEVHDDKYSKDTELLVFRSETALI